MSSGEFARPIGVAAQHPDRFFAHDERHSQQRHQMLLLDQIDLADRTLVFYILHSHRPLGCNDAIGNGPAESRQRF
jgi:hypothetical protein